MTPATANVEISDVQIRIWIQIRIQAIFGWIRIRIRGARIRTSLVEIPLGNCFESALNSHIARCILAVYRDLDFAHYHVMTY